MERERESRMIDTERTKKRTQRDTGEFLVARRVCRAFNLNRERENIVGLYDNRNAVQDNICL